MELVTSEQMQRIDRHAIRTMKIPSLLLMECAGMRVVEAMQRRIADLSQRRILVVCGKGNNGGDGLVVARHLHAQAYEAHALIAADPHDLSPDARANLKAARGAGVRVMAASTPAAWGRMFDGLAGYDLIVDALLGTGLQGPVRGLPGRVIRDLAGCSIPVVAVDLPSGLSGDTGGLTGPAITAGLTIALCRPKLAHAMPPACLRAGEIEVANIGIPRAAVESAGIRLFAVERSDFEGFIPPRPRDAHKGTFGHALVVAGGEGKAGAAALASRASLRVGAGLVSVATPSGVRAEVAGFTPEVMTISIPGPPSREGAAVPMAMQRRYVAGVVDRLLSEAEGKTSVALGPGLGRDPLVTEWIRAFVGACSIPMVVDADGLNAFGSRVGSRRPARERGAPTRRSALAGLSGRQRTLVLTPHAGEMARLLGSSPADVVNDRLGAALALSRAAHAIVVLKGMASIIAVPDGRAFVNRTGNPGMSTAGTGDLLTGMIAGLLAQRLDPLRAVLFAVHVHGRAGDIADETIGEQAMMASDILDHLPEAFREFKS